MNALAAADAGSFWVKLKRTFPKVPLGQECAQTLLVNLNEVMMPLEACFKDTSVVSVHAVHWFIFFSTAMHTGSLCTCWQELVIWNSLQGWAVKSLVGKGYSYSGKGRMRQNKREHLPSKAYWAVRFQSLSESIDFLPHIWLHVLLHPSLTTVQCTMGVCWWLWPHQETYPHIDLCWRQAQSFI